MSVPNRPSPSSFPRHGSYSEALRVSDLLRQETVGGALLVIMAAVAIVWANTPWADVYYALRAFAIGPEALHLHLSLGTWAADGLLAIFFFMVGLELKVEFVAGDLRNLRTAVVPVTAAVAGVAIPALLYVAVVQAGPEYINGWAIPTATDIAFAVAVLAIIGSHLPRQLRLFLLTLAVVDDLIAISIIAIFYTDEIHVPELLGAVGVVAVYGVIAHVGRRWFLKTKWAAWAILLPLGVVAWALLHASGIHATLAGVALGLVVPVRDPDPTDTEPEKHGLAEDLEHRFRPLSTGFAVPLFAFFSAGVTLGGVDGFTAALTSPVTLGIIAGLVLGKPIGIVLGVWLTTAVGRVRLDPSLRWIDLIGVGLLGGIGFTVSLLVAELSFDHASPEGSNAKVAILLASLISSALASILLSIRNAQYKAIEAQESIDADGDGIPDVYEADDGTL